MPQTEEAAPLASKTYLNRREAAEYLGVAVTTLDRMVAHGVVKKIKPHPLMRTARFRRAGLDAAMERRSR